jgi:hypothetical protein
MNVSLVTFDGDKPLIIDVLSFSSVPRVGEMITFTDVLSPDKKTVKRSELLKRMFGNIDEITMIVESVEYYVSGEDVSYEIVLAKAPD